MITERELVALLYRAEWTRLTLSGTVRAPGPVIDARSPLAAASPTAAETTFADRVRARLSDPAPWFFDLDPGDVLRPVLVAPGRRFRVTDTDGSRAFGSDGERLWSWRPGQPTGTGGTQVRLQPPYRLLLMPSWLLNGYTLTIEGEETDCGRAGLRVRAAPKPVAERSWLLGRWTASRLFSGTPSWMRERSFDPVDAVVDAELGILLRCSRTTGSQGPLVAAFESLQVGDPAPADQFSAPTGSSYVGAPSVSSPLESLTQETIKAVAGIAAGGLGALIKFGSSRQADPFAQATTEDFGPEDIMPADEPAPDRMPSPADGSVSDEVLDRLYRSGTAAPRFTATLHEWVDPDGLLSAVPESARRAGFGGVGFLVDAVRGQWEDEPGDVHQINAVRLECDLSDSTEVTVDGRRAFRVVARAQETADWWNRLLFPAVAVVNAETGLPLRLTRYAGGQPVTRVELRDLAEPGPDASFGFTPPTDRPLLDRADLCTVVSGI